MEHELASAIVAAVCILLIIISAVKVHAERGEHSLYGKLGGTPYRPLH
jgi:hypothetical protein